MIEISTKALELNAGMDFLYVYLTKSAEPNTKGRNKDLVNHVRTTSISKESYTRGEPGLPVPGEAVAQ